MLNGLRVFYTYNRLTLTYLLLWPVLLFFSFFYLLAVEIIKFLYRKNILVTYHAGIKVISIGNITLGGSGKTPLAEYLSLYFSARGKKPAVLLKGYKRPKINAGIGTQAYYSLGDEAGMLESSLQDKAVVVSNSNRTEAVRQLQESGCCGVVILDDGFQHWRLHRDMDIVVIDATNPFGNGCILPLGPLREGINSLKRAQIICLSRINEAPSKDIRMLEARLKRINPSALLIKAVHEPEFIYDAVSGERSALDDLRGRKVSLLCAIANPGSFLKLVDDCQAEVVSKNFYDDHHQYSQDELVSVVRTSLDKGAEFIVTTQKDIVRFRSWLDREKPGIRVYVLRVFLKIAEGETDFDQRLYSLCNA